MGVVVYAEVVEEEEEEVEGFRRRGDVSEGEVEEGEVEEGDGGMRVSAAVILGGGDVVVLVVFGVLVVGQRPRLFVDGRGWRERGRKTLLVAPDQTRPRWRRQTCFINIGSICQGSDRYYHCFGRGCWSDRPSRRSTSSRACWAWDDVLSDLGCIPRRAKRQWVP